MSLKMGRPREENPNTINLTVMIYSKLNKKLTAYCEEKNISKGEVVRNGIEMVLGKKK